MFSVALFPNNTMTATGFPETRAIYGTDSDPRVDLHGYRIDSFSLHVNSLSINVNGNWTDVSYSYTIAANGAVVPEPSSTALVLLGAVALFVGVRRSRIAVSATGS